MPEYFRDTGFEKTSLVATITGSATGILAPGSGNSIYLLGANAHAPTVLRETNAFGTRILVIASGNCNLPATVKVTENTAVYATIADHLSLFYYIDKS